MAQEIADSKLIDTWSSSGLIVEPDVSKIIEGWQLGEQPPHEYMNWLQNTFGSKLNHILKNGVVSWNNETEYLVGSSVQHNGNVWLCKTTNTNSEPADANANWKRIITVESLTTVLGGYVKNSGNETIGGVKTFSSNPISSATQSTAVNALTRKDYVDGLDSANVKLTGNQTIAGVKTFSSTISGNINGNATTATTLTSRGGFPTADGQDFNTLTETGVYFVQPGNFSGTLNSPGDYGTLFVNSAYPFISQLYISNDDGIMRGRAAYNSSWSEWSKYVNLSGNQTIAGVKTFSSSPIVPTPTAGTQAVNKDYADLKVALASFTGANQSLSYNGYQKLPGGLILQWGLSAPTTDSVNVNFPISFPNSVLHANEHDIGGVSGLSKTIWQFEDVIKSGFNALNIGRVTKNQTTISTSISASCTWFAIGY